MPAVEDLLALWETDLEFAGWDPGPIPIINSPPASTWIWSDLHLSDPGSIEAFGRPFADARAMNAHLLEEWRRRVRPDETIINRASRISGSRNASGRLSFPGHRRLCTAPGFLDTSLGYAAWRSSYSSRASSGVR